MKMALVTTTINVPLVLKSYRQFMPADVVIIVAGDLKTPASAKDLVESLYNATYRTPQDQKIYRSSELIGWNTDSRRNFAILEALKWGADVIITIDDDMIPTPTFFYNFERIFDGKFSGLQLGAAGQWFDHGQFTIPPAPARGLPPEMVSNNAAEHVHGVPIGIAQGSILGVPDTDAVTAIATNPVITGVSDILRYGFVTHPACYSVCNSQITAFRREFAPGAAQFYKLQGRNTDILSSLMMRAYARDHGFYTHYGLPIGYHARSVRSRFKDLEAEMFGLRVIEDYARQLAKDALWLPPGVPVEVWDAWQIDCQEAMK